MSLFCEPGKRDPRRIATGGRSSAFIPRILRFRAIASQVLERTSVIFNPDYVEARFTVGLPAQGRTVMGQWAAQILAKNLMVHVERALHFNNLVMDVLGRTFVGSSYVSGAL